MSTTQNEIAATFLLSYSHESHSGHGNIFGDQRELTF